MPERETITLIGAGLVGSLLAIILAKRGFKVEILERRPDMRKQLISAGRSINLAISERGLNALRQIDLEEDVLSQAISMKGRMIHSLDGGLSLQPYSPDQKHSINSISRATLNKLLMDKAEATGQVTITFNKRLFDIDLDSKLLEVINERNGRLEVFSYNKVIGTDGSASAVRHKLSQLNGAVNDESMLEHGYKELLIPAGQDGAFQLEKNALHIWPRGTFMLIALPNFEATYTCTLFLPFKGPASFEQLEKPEAVTKFFEEQFADAVPLLHDLTGTFLTNPTGHMVTVKCAPWSYEDQVLLMGDAAHGIVPFYGQGMNCGFEDCTIFAECLDNMLNSGHNSPGDWQQLFSNFWQMRKPHTDAIADMAVENFLEMRDKVADPKFQLHKQVEQLLEKTFPGKFNSRYSLVTFSNEPYMKAMQQGKDNEALLETLCKDIKVSEDVDLNYAASLLHVS